MSKGKKPDSLTPRDKAVWDEVTKTVTPLGNRPETPPPPKTVGRHFVRQDRIPAEWYSGNNPGPEPKLDRKTRRNITKGRQDFDRSVDLHGMTQDQAFARLKSVVEGCVLRGDKILLVVTGKGGKRFSQLTADTPVAYRTRNDFEQHGGVLKRMVPLWLAGPELKPLIHSYGPAAQDHGGDGALYVILRRQKVGR